MDVWYSRPILCVADVAASALFYAGKLGFKESWRHAEGGELLVLQIERGGCELILSCQWPERVGKGLIFLSLAPAELDAARAEFEASDVEIKESHWGYRLMRIDDPDGNQLLFSYPTVTSAVGKPEDAQ